MLNYDWLEKGQKAFQGISFPIYLNDSIYFLSDFNDAEELSLPLISLSAGYITVTQKMKRRKRRAHINGV